MKHCLPLLYFIVFFGAAHAQRIRLTDTANSWHISCSGGGTEYYDLVYDYAFKGDTIIAGITYKRLAAKTTVLELLVPAMGYPVAQTCFLREDTVTGKVWARRARDTSEQVIYNARWQPDDTVVTASPAIHGSGKYYVRSIDSVQIGGDWYRMFRMSSAYHNTGSADYLDIIDGMGSSAGLAYMFTGTSALEYDVNLACFFHNGSKPTITPQLNNYQHFTNLGPCNLAVQDGRGGIKPVLLPMPITAASRIMLSQPIMSGKILISNRAGAVVARAPYLQYGRHSTTLFSLARLLLLLHYRR